MKRFRAAGKNELSQEYDADEEVAAKHHPRTDVFLYPEQESLFDLCSCKLHQNNLECFTGTFF